MYGGEVSCDKPGIPTVSCGRPTVTQRLQGEKADLEARLEKVNTALALLEKNPEFATCIDALGRVLL